MKLLVLQLQLQLQLQVQLQLEWNAKIGQNSAQTGNTEKQCSNSDKVGATKNKQMQYRDTSKWSKSDKTKGISVA